MGISCAVYCTPTTDERGVPQRGVPSTGGLPIHQRPVTIGGSGDHRRCSKSKVLYQRQVNRSERLGLHRAHATEHIPGLKATSGELGGCVTEASNTSFGTEHRVNRVPGFLSGRPNWVPPFPNPQESVASSLGPRGGDTLAWGGVGGGTRFRLWDRHSGTLGIL